MKVLCGTDFSEQAGVALQVATDLLRQAEDTLVLCHVYNPPVASTAVLEASTALELNRTLRRGIEHTLEKAAAPLREQGLRVETLLADGAVAVNLAEVAEEADADIIVVGSHGGGLSDHFLVGNVPDRLVERSDRPVLIVRGASDGFSAWARGERPLRILVGVDLTRASEAAMKWLHGMRALGPCDITLLHLYWPPVEYARLGLRGRRTFTETDPEIAEIVAREIERRLGDLPGEGTVQVHVTPSIGSVSYPLGHWSQRQQADVVVVGHHHRGFFSRLWKGSVAHTLLSRFEVPVACISETPPEAGALEQMPGYQRVVVALDVDDGAPQVMAHALALTEAGGEVEICHVIPGPIRPPEESRLDPEARDRLRERFDSLIPHEALEYCQGVRLHLIEGGEIGPEIIALCERLGADAVVIGSHGHSGARRALVGSVAEWVLRHCERPTLMIRTYPE